MKFKKIMSLLLVLTLISSLLTTVSLLNPMAEDTEATTPAETTNYDTNVLHFKGLSAPVDSQIAVYLRVPADNIVAGEPYTVNLTMHGKTASDGLTFGDYRDLAVRQGTAKISTTPALAMYAGSTKKGTMSALYTGGKKWSVTVTPTAKDALYIGLRIQKDAVVSADFYMGNLEVIDKNGNNIAPKITESTVIHTSVHHDNGITNSVNVANSFKIAAVESIDDIEDADLKQKLVNDFYTGDSMIHFKQGSGQGLINIFKKIPASKLKANTTYTYTVRYNNPDAFGDASRYFVISDKVAGKNTTFSSANASHTKLSGYVNCYEFTAEYTTGDTANELNVGFRINKSGWGTADFYIADMQFVEKGTTQNLLTSLTEMCYYYAVSDGGAVNPFIPSVSAYNYIVATKCVLDKDKYFEPENLEAAKYLLHAKGQASPSTVRGIAVQVPATRLTEGEEYTVNVTLKSNKALNSTYNVLLVQSGEAKGGMIAHTGASTAEAKGTTTTNYSGAIKWTVKIQPDASKNLYIGMYFNTANLTSIDFYLGNVEVIDSNGNNVAPAFAKNTQLHTFASWGGAVLTANDTTESAFFEKREFVRMDRVEDETIKQTLYDAYYNGDSMLKFSVGSVNEQQCIYKRIPKAALEGNKKYKLSIKYSGLTLSANDFVVVRDVATAASPIMTSSGKQTTNVDKYTNHSVYTDYYTTPETPTDLYIGFYLRKSAWSTAQLYIADMQFVDADGNNLFTSIADTRDLYAGYNNGAISKFTSSNTLVNLEKQVLDTEKFSEPVSTDRKMINVSCINGANNAKFYVKVPHTLSGTYQVTYKVKGIDLIDGRYFDVRTNTPMATNSSTIESVTQVARPSLDEATLEFTTTDFSDVYLGFTIPMKHVTAMNFYIEKLELVRIVDGMPSENLIDENLDIAKFHRHNANNGESEAWTVLNINSNGYADYNTVFRVSVMDYDESILYPSQIVNLKGGEEQSQNYQYAKKASNLKAGTYRLTLIEQGANIKTSTNQRFWVDLNGSQIVNTYWESGREYVETFGTSSYKFQYDVTVEEDGASVMGGFTIGYTYMPEFNAYITEISLVKIDEQGNAISENLFSDLNVRDWCGEAGTLLGIEKYGSTSVRLKNIDLGVADANRNGKTDIADIRILSKMQDAGITLTEGVNDVTFVRNTVLNAAS